MAMLTESTYLNGLKNGDKSSFKQIYDLYHSSVYHYCRKFLIDESFAEDATADVFIKLWEKHAIIDDSKSIRPFLFKLAKDISYNYLRKIASDDRLKEAYIKRYPLVEKQDAELSYIEKENQIRLDTLIDSLPGKRKEIFKLRYEEGLDYKSIAQRLDISANTVKVQLVRARSFLKNKFAVSDISHLF